MGLFRNIKTININNLPGFLKNKYFIASFIFLIWIGFFDQNSLVDRIRNMNQMHQLERDKQYYLEKIEESTQQLEELKTNKENLEKFAREQYLMKEEDEEIFLIIEE